MKHSTLLGSSLNLGREQFRSLRNFLKLITFIRLHQASMNRKDWWKTVSNQESFLEETEACWAALEKRLRPIMLPRKASLQYVELQLAPGFMNHYAFWGRLCWHCCVRVISASANNLSSIIFTITSINLVDEITKVGFVDSFTLVCPQTPSESE